MSTVSLLVKDIALSPDSPEELACETALKKLKKHGLLHFANGQKNTAYISRRSIDARKKDSVRLIYTVTVSDLLLKKERLTSLPEGISSKVEEAPLPQKGQAPLSHPAVIVGSGPAGLFSALLLAEEGYRPLLVERGGDISERVQAIEKFYSSRVLDTETNVQFGAGGAGTFSDGKLVTRVNDPMNNYVLRRFCEFGAPKEILVHAKPHIGTDILRTVVSNMVEKIRSLGGEVRFHTCLEDLTIKNGRLFGVRLNGTDVPCEALILAIGHSARDTYEMLLQKPLMIECKPFSVGMRIEHLQSEIDQAMYGSFAGHPKLGHAEYSLSANTDTRGVYTFCMCPGGEVMAAASEEGGLVVNGMSHHARSGRNANAAIAVSVFPEDYGATPECAIAYQRSIERAAFCAGGGDYTAPLCTVGDLLENSYRTEPKRITPTYMGGHAFRIADPSSFLPAQTVTSLREGICAFGRRLHGFDTKDALLTGAETRTSAPIRILRNPEREAVGCQGLYPCGEGAGYAGGITSAALDGLRTAMALMACYAPPF